VYTVNISVYTTVSEQCKGLVARTRAAEALHGLESVAHNGSVANWSVGAGQGFDVRATRDATSGKLRQDRQGTHPDFRPTAPCSGGCPVIEGHFGIPSWHSMGPVSLSGDRRGSVGQVD